MIMTVYWVVARKNVVFCVCSPLLDS